MRALLLLVLAVLGAGWSAPSRAVTLIEQAQLTLALRGQAPAQAPQPQTVALPYDWDQRQGAVDGEARFAFDIPVADPAAPLALFVPRLGNSFRVLVNGQELARFGAFPPGPYDDASVAPQYFVLPASGSTAPHRVEVVIAAQAARQGGLSPVVVGSKAEVLPLYENALFWARFLQFGVIFIPIALCHVSFLVAQIRIPKWLTIGAYVFHILLFLSNFTDFFLEGVKNVGYAWYSLAGTGFWILSAIFSLVWVSVGVLVWHRRTLPPQSRFQSRSTSRWSAARWLRRDRRRAR